MTIDGTHMIGWLRAAGEPSRLRLLALCEQRDLSARDLAEALTQSEPRVSRHLRILTESGLIERRRIGQWVHYQLTSDPPAAAFVKGLLSQLDRNDPLFAHDLGRSLIQKVSQGSSTARMGTSRLGRAFSDFIAETAPASRMSRIMVLGVEHLELMDAAAGLAEQCTVMAHSRRAAQVARAYAERRGLRCRFMAADRSIDSASYDLSKYGYDYDAVLVDHVGTAALGRFDKWVAAGMSVLAPQGRMWLFERYESLEAAREKVVEHPLARMRRLLSEMQLSCERLSPIESDNQHVLAAVAVPAAFNVFVRRA